MIPEEAGGTPAPHVSNDPREANAHSGVVQAARLPEHAGGTPAPHVSNDPREANAHSGVVQAARLPAAARRLGSDFVDPRTTPFVEPTSRGELPHLYKDAGTYFVTFRLWDAVLPREERTISKRAKMIDPTAIFQAAAPPIRQGSCLLADPTHAGIVQSALLHFNDIRYRLLAWSVMPNHVHVVVQPIGTNTPSAILHTWKSFTAHELNRRLKRTGPVWERESFDHLVRSSDHLDRFIRYVEENPVAAGLCGAPGDWSWSSASLPSRDQGGSVQDACGTPAPQTQEACGTPAPQRNQKDGPR